MTDVFPLQLRHLGDPWRLVVIPLLLNRARAETAAPIAAELFECWPHAGALQVAHPDRLRDLLTPLGFQEQRATRLRALARAWSREERDGLDPARRTGVLDLPGCGPYADASWRIFALGEADVETDDVALRRYLASGQRNRRL